MTATPGRAGLAVLSAVLTGLALTGCSGGASSGADCVAPSIAINNPEVRPGASATVTGSDFIAACIDSGTFTGDDVDSMPTPSGEPTMQTTGLAVTWEQGGATVELGTVDADKDGTFSTTVTIPENATRGNASITVGDMPAIPLTVSVP